MKNVFNNLVVLIMCSFFITGCNSKELKNISNNLNNGTLNCSKEEIDDDGYKSTDTMEVSYRNNIVKNVKNTILTEMDADLIETSLAFGEVFANAFNEIDGFTMSYTKANENTIKLFMEIDYSKLDLEKLKEAYGEDFKEDSIYSSKDFTLDQFKEENLKDYVCE